jgi:cytochrome d ubiquinol oxidase subunit I
MDAVWLARLQFALTVGFHYLFPPLSIGLSWMIFRYQTRFLRTGAPVYRQMSRFWTRLFAITFAVGVATGITMEFQFGTNWAAYSRFVGDIFGAPLAAEALIAFFLESSFLALLLFGWDKVSRKVHAFAALMVAVGSTLSAFWIVVANSWQQTPAGFQLAKDAAGNVVRAELTSFWQAVFNPSTLPRYTHVIAGACVLGAFFVAGISAWYLRKGLHAEFAKKSLAVALVFGLVATLGSAAIGDWHTRQVAKTQPEKFAAMEAIFKTQSGAPLLLVGYPLPDFGIPKLLSLMVYGDPNAEVKGLDAFPPEDLPPVMFTAMSFHAMVWPGFFCVLVMLYGVFLLWRKKLDEKKWFLALLFWLIPLPYFLNQIGWFTAEIGRQPWTVYHLLRTSQSHSLTVPAGQILASIVMFTLIYAVLFALFFYLTRKTILEGPVKAAGGKEVSA